MRVAMVLPSLRLSATITVALSLAAELSRLGHIVDIIYFDEKVERSVPEGCRAYRISFFRKFDFSSYDVVHSHNLRPDLYVSIHRCLSQFACVSTIHNYVSEELESYYGKFISLVFTQIWRLAWSRFDKLVCLTCGAVDYYKILLPNSDISYVYNGVFVDDAIDVVLDDKLVSAVSELKLNGYFVLGTYCNQTKGKGLDQVVRFVKEESSVSAIFIGDGPEKSYLVSLAADLGVENRCLFFPFLPSAYIYNRLFDSYVISSRCEGFGLSLVEASFCNVKIMCSDIPVFREMFDDTQVSFFKLDDIESMREVVRQMKGGVDKRRYARLRALSVFSVDAMTHAYLEIYRLALKNIK